MEALPLAPIPLPDVASPPSFSQLRLQAQAQEARRRAGAAGDAAAVYPRLVLGDGVRSFDELSASCGALGRFTGASIMPIIKQLCGRGGAGGGA